MIDDILKHSLTMSPIINEPINYAKPMAVFNLEGDIAICFGKLQVIFSRSGEKISIFLGKKIRYFSRRVIFKGVFMEFLVCEN
jgi:hypothetical protein